MKRIIILPLLLSLCVASVSFAHAETLREQVSAPEHVTGAFVSETGNTVFILDANVDIPNVETVPRFPVTCGSFTMEDAIRLAKAVLPDATWQTEQAAADLSFVSDAQLTCNAPNENIWRSIDASHQVTSQGEKYGAALSYTVRHDVNRNGRGGVNYLPTESYPLTSGQIDGHALSAMQAVSRANQLVAQATDQPFRLTNVGWIRGFLYDDEKENPDAGYTYKMTYRRVVAGVPLLAVHEMMLPSEKQGNPYAVPVGYETMTVVFDEFGDVAAFDWLHPFMLGAAEAEDWSLLPFSAVIDIAKTLLPLSWDHLEKDGNSDVTICRVALEYMPVLYRDQPLNYVLTPVWNFYGNGELPWFHCAIQNYSFLTINAADDTVIDRNFGY